MTLSSPLLLEAAEAAAGAQRFPAGALFVVATPIGNLADISLRAVQALRLADRVACEDTRQAGALLQHLGLHKPLLALHAHNEQAAAARVCEHLAAGERVAYVSDAGTPCVSDPGAALVAAAREAGHAIVPIPGPSSLLAALSVAGDRQARGFRFVGFLPARGTERQAAIGRCLDDTDTQVLFEAPHRVAALADELAQLSGAARLARPLTICRELTKQFESVHTTTVGQWPAWLAADANRARGEFVLVLHAVARPADAGGLPQPARAALAALLEELPLKQAVALAVRITGAPRNLLYAAALEMRP